METIIKDWNTDSENKSQNYSLKVVNNGSGEGIYVTVEGKDNKLGIELAIEINQGVPAVHIWSCVGGDPTLHLHRTQEGLILSPEVRGEIQSLEKDPIYSHEKTSFIVEDPHVCDYCGEPCWEGEGCDEFQAGGFDNCPVVENDEVKNFKVEVIRSESQTIVLNVVAKNEEEARRFASVEAGDVEFSRGEADYEYNVVNY